VKCRRLLPLLAALWLLLPEIRRQSDLEVFVRAGAALLHGSDPYTPVDDPALWGGHAYVYPWLASAVFTPLALIPWTLAKLVWYVAGAAAVIAACRLLRSGLREGAVAALLLSAPFLRNAELGAVNAIFALALACAWRWRHQDGVVAAAMVVLVGAKLFLAPLLLWVVLARSRRCAALTIAWLTAFFAISFAVGPLSLPGYLQSLSLLADHEAGGSLRHLLALQGLPHLLAPLVAAVVVMACVRARDDKTLFVGCVTAGLLATPILWTHYLLLALILVVLLRPRAVLPASLFSWVVLSAGGLPPLGGLGVEPRLLMLHLSLLLLPALAWRNRVPRQLVGTVAKSAARSTQAVAECVQTDDSPRRGTPA
jgi:alpha-1,2-mannosyltransferase